MAVYAVSDLHGCLAFYEQIKAYIQPEDKIYFLGDAGDRGIEPWKTIKAVAADPQWTYIQGNHEDMLWKAMDEYEQGCPGGYDFSLLAHNGGAPTFDGWLADGADKSWISWLRKLPTHIEYTRPDGKKVFLSHAGYTPDHWGNMPKANDLIWSRDHFYDPWDDELPDAYVVHGHTPTPLMEGWQVDPRKKNRAGALEYCEGHKFCIDNGAVFTGVCVLFNLDTFESIIFQAGAEELGVD